MSDTYETTPDVDVSDDSAVGDPEIEIDVDFQTDMVSEEFTISKQTEDFDWDTPSKFMLNETIELSEIEGHTATKVFTVIIEYDPDVGGKDGFSVTDWGYEL